MKKNNLMKYLLVAVIGVTTFVCIIAGGLFSSKSSDKTKENTKVEDKLIISKNESDSSFMGSIQNTSEAQKQYELALQYYKGDGKEQDYVKARKHFEVAAKNGNIESLWILGKIYHEGLGVTKNYSKAMEYFRKSAQAGDPWGAYSLAHYYYHGKGVKKDMARAVELYKKSAAQGFYGAQFELGYCYEHGICVKKDIQKAVELYQASADQDYSIAEYHLGNCYFYGKGVKRDYARAIMLYKLAAEKGNVHSGMKLINCYYNGIGVKKNFKKCIYWLGQFYREYIQQEKNAQDVIYDIATRYESGDGLEQDYTEAFAWYSKAHKLGHAHATYCVGIFFETGVVVNKNLDKAIQKYKLAADRGDKDAKEALKRLDKSL